MFRLNALFCTTILLKISCGLCAEFPPVYMWGTVKMSEHVSALYKTSEDSFKDTLLEYLKNNIYIIVFAENTLSPEDLAQRDQNGNTAFPHISSLKESDVDVIYKPYVQNPIGAIKQLNRKLTELSIQSLLNSPNVPKDNILIIDLNDAKEDEQRFHMLQRHDSDIYSIYNDISKQHDNVLAIYTGRHTSWVASEEITHKKSRRLLADETNSTQEYAIFRLEHILLCFDGDAIWTTSSNNTIILNGNYTASEEEIAANRTILTLSSPEEDANSTNSTLSSPTFIFEFSFNNDTQYWSIETVTAKENASQENETVFHLSGVFAPVRFSYHCSSLSLVANKSRFILSGFQIQYYPSLINSTNLTFGDAYDCVGFTSIPIWSGLFVTIILLLILTFGLTMMLDIKTMDRFDDAKGKTITINASE